MSLISVKVNLELLIVGVISARESCQFRTLTGLLQELENRLMSQGASLSDYLQMAGMTEEDLRDRLGKTGGTAYRCEHVVTLVDEGLSLPASAVNGLRREALDAPAVWRKKRRNGQKGESCPAC